MAAVETLISMSASATNGPCGLAVEGLKTAKAARWLLLAVAESPRLCGQAPGATDMIMPHVRRELQRSAKSRRRTLRALLEAKPRSRAGASRSCQGPGGVDRERWSECRARVAAIEALGSIGAAAAVTARSWPG